MQIHNTLTRKKEEFTPITPGTVLFYHCGPTVYWTQHIGNLRAVACADFIVRTLRYLGYVVSHVRNYTDVGHLTSDADSGEDKMEKGVKREGLSPKEIADKYIGIYEKDIDQLNTIRPSFSPRATEYIQEMQRMIGVLLKKDFAYKTELAIYFDVSKFKDYTKLSHQKLDEELSGAGKGDVIDSEKKNTADFALWFFKKGAHTNALQTWQSPWGEGFPGWHIECSAMSKALLGPTLDLHMGGVEHIPVHHTNEIAQSEAANGVKFVNYWVHNEHLIVDDSKMAKSSGTSYCVQDITDKGFDPLVLRYFYLQAHYRSKQNFTWEALSASQNALENLYQIVFAVNYLCHSRPVTEYGVNSSGNLVQSNGSRVKPGMTTQKTRDDSEWKIRFRQALEDDFNIPAALAVLWDLLNSQESAEAKLSLALEFDNVLGLRMEKILDITIPSDVTRLGEIRKKLRKGKKFEEADKVRDQIESFGYEVEDGGKEVVIRPRKILIN